MASSPSSAAWATATTSPCSAARQSPPPIRNAAPHSPIIFTAENDDLADPADLGPTDRQLWGGLVVLGRARINSAVNANGDAAVPRYEVYEGLEDVVVGGQNVFRFGGDDDGDSSGVLRYVSLRHGGQKLSPDKEINGLSLGGVGRGTVIEYIEALSFADDGYEFFGGSVNTRYLVSAFNDDDAFDVDMGYSGDNQFWFALQANDRRDNGGEINGELNERNDGTRVPVSDFRVYNATLIGAGAGAGGTANNHTFLFRRFSRGQFYNSVFTDFNGQPLNGGGPQTGAVPALQDNLWWGYANPVFTNLLFTTAANNNATNVNPRIRGISRAADGGLDPRPAPGSPALGGGRPTPPGLTPASFQGAFGGLNWASDWSGLSAMGILTSAGGGNPPPVPPTQPITLTVTAGTGSLTLAWTGGSAPFVVERKGALTDAAWTTVTNVTERTATVPVTGDAGFLRVGGQ
ncbi:MAG: hypothetical protein ACKVYV_07500 [Limisphaerales bacterium]